MNIEDMCLSRFVYFIRIGNALGDFLYGADYEDAGILLINVFSSPGSLAKDLYATRFNISASGTVADTLKNIYNRYVLIC